jgi:hypothetical protein
MLSSLMVAGNLDFLRTRPCPRRARSRQSRTPLAPSPTNALPGTREKVTVLAERARMKVALWHPDDAVPERPFTARAAV